MNKRVVYLDVIRGLAILLVVIGHLIQYNYDNFLENSIFNVIYSFHMPLFFFLSGCTTAVKEKHQSNEIPSFIDFLKDCMGKTQRILVPAVVWGMIFCAINQIKPSLGIFFSCYWFLYVLLFINLFWDTVLYIYKYLGKPLWWIGGCIFLIAATFIVGLKRIPLLYLSAFVYGYFFQSRSYIKSLNIWETSLLFFTFIVLVPFYRYGDNIAGDPSRVWLMIPIAITACPLCLLLGQFLARLSPLIVKGLTMIGIYSLGIYLAHMTIIRYHLIPDFIQAYSLIGQIIILTLVATGIVFLCIGFQRIIQLFPILSKVLYGK